jgi:hypothetical protein
VFLELNKLYIKREKSDESVQSLDREDSDEEDKQQQQSFFGSDPEIYTKGQHIRNNLTITQNLILAEQKVKSTSFFSVSLSFPACFIVLAV